MRAARARTSRASLKRRFVRLSRAICSTCRRHAVCAHFLCLPCAGDYNYALERDQKGKHVRPAVSARERPGSALERSRTCSTRLDAPHEREAVHSPASPQSKPQQADVKSEAHAAACVAVPEHSERATSAVLDRQSAAASASASREPPPPGAPDDARRRAAAAEAHYAQGYAARKAVRATCHTHVCQWHCHNIMI